MADSPSFPTGRDRFTEAERTIVTAGPRHLARLIGDADRREQARRREPLPSFSKARLRARQLGELHREIQLMERRIRQLESDLRAERRVRKYAAVYFARRVKAVSDGG